MENKINVAGLLKNCPYGMELNCPMFDNLYLDKVDNDEIYPIKAFIKNEDNTLTSVYFTKCGTYNRMPYAKCVIFPKGKTNWEEFQRPFKDGDIVFYDNCVSIFKEWGIGTLFRNYVKVNIDGRHPMLCDRTDSNGKGIKREARFATEEEKEKLLRVIKYNGYRWNPETKKLEKLIKPIFKKGDKVRVKKGFPEPRIARVIEDVCDTFYTLVSVGKIDFTDQDNWELVPTKFDISKLKHFDRVLVRDFDSEVWEIDFFSRLLDGKHFKCIGASYVQCIPYKGNEYLYNTTDACNTFYKTWEE